MSGIDRRLDFRLLKRAVSIERVLAHRGVLARMRRRAGQLVGACPIHGGDNVNAFVVHPDRNLWHCFSRCHTGGDVVELVRRLDDCGYRQAALYLAALAGNPVGAITHYAPVSPPPRFHPFTAALRLDPAVPFLLRKGIRAETARRFEVGAFHGTGMLAGCVAVRLHDPDGQVLGYAGRRLQPDAVSRFGKWVFPPRLPRNSLLYGYHRAIPLAREGLVLVECPWGVLRLAQLGLPAVALMGCHLSPQQQTLLAGLNRIVLLLDGDPAGRQAAAAIRLRLNRAVVVNLPEGLDPDDLSDTDLARAADLLFL